MAYTFTEITFTPNETFDSLYEDSLTSLESGTVNFTDTSSAATKKDQLKRLMCDQDYLNMKNIEVAKDGEVCMWVQGTFENNTYTWMNVLVGKLNNSKSWCSSAEFHQEHKDWILSIGGNKFQLDIIKGAEIDDYFTRIHEAGICLGTLSTLDREKVDDTPQSKIMTWEY